MYIPLYIYINHGSTRHCCPSSCLVFVTASDVTGLMDGRTTMGGQNLGSLVEPCGISHCHHCPEWLTFWLHVDDVIACQASTSCIRLSYGIIE
jgi:hypothetical protein